MIFGVVVAVEVAISRIKCIKAKEKKERLVQTVGSSYTNLISLGERPAVRTNWASPSGRSTIRQWGFPRTSTRTRRRDTVLGVASEHGLDAHTDALDTLDGAPAVAI